MLKFSWGVLLLIKIFSIQLGNIIVQSIIEPISPVLNQFKEKGLILEIGQMKELFDTF